MLGLKLLLLIALPRGNVERLLQQVASNCVEMRRWLGTVAQLI